MKYIVICYVALLVSCQSGNKPKKVESDTTKVETSNNINDSSEDEPTYQDMQKEYTLMYNKEIDIDTSLQVKGQIFNLRFKHYCLFDTLVIPSKYSWAESPKDFYTHNFASKLLVTEGNDTLVNTIIKKDMFNQLLDESLIKYGVLSNPNFRGYNQTKDVIQFQYSISVPLTDVGKGVLLDIGLNGEIKASKE